MRSIDRVAGSLADRSESLYVRLILLGILAALVACETLTPTAPLPDHAVAFNAPAEYRSWWVETEACSGREGQLDGIAWFVVPNVSIFMTPQGEAVARWSRGSGGTQIVVAGTYLGNDLVVRHEMLHALLDRGDHPPEYFVERCHLTWASWGA